MGMLPAEATEIDAGMRYVATLHLKMGGLMP